MTFKKQKLNKAVGFEKELTWTGTKEVKQLRKGPSFKERKDHFEMKNPGQKFKYKKK